MANFKSGDTRFNLRASGFCLNEGKVLAVFFKTPKPGFWTLPGGRCNLLEITDKAIIREYKEELDEEVEVIKPVWVVENFYEFKGEKLHEILMIYEVKLDSKSKLYKYSNINGKEGDEDLLFKWIEVDKLSEHVFIRNF